MKKSIVRTIKEKNKKYKRAIRIINTISYIFAIAIIIAFESGAVRMCSEITNDSYFIAMVLLTVFGSMLMVGNVYCAFIYPTVHKYKSIIERNNARLNEIIHDRDMKLRQLEKEYE